MIFHHRLRNVNIWNAIIGKAEPSQLKSIRNLKREWKKAGSYAHFTLNALFNAIELLSQLSDLIDLALNELQNYKKKIELTAYDQYFAYLQNYKAIIKKQQKHIANNLFYRVELAFINQDETKHDFTHHLIQRFHQIGFITPEFLADMQAIQPEPDAIDFPLAMSFILQHSTVREQKVKKQSKLPSYFGFDSTINSKKIDGEFCLIPDTLLSYVPQKRPVWIFQGQRARYRFFKNKSHLLKNLISIRYNQQEAPSVEELLFHDKWNMLSKLSKQINELKLEATQLKMKSSSIFSRKSRQFYQEWESILVDQGCYALKEQIDLLEKVANQPASINELFSKPSMDAETNKKILLQLKSLEQNSMFSQLKEEDQIRFKDIKNKIEVRCQRNGELEAVEVGLAELAANKPLNSQEFKQLFRFLFNGTEEENLRKFYYHHTDNLTRIFAFVEEVLKVDANAVTLLSIEQITLLTQQIKIVEIFSQLEEVKEANLLRQFEPLLDSFIKQYENFLYSSIPTLLKEKEALLVRFEKTISHLLVLMPTWQLKLDTFLLLTHDRLPLQKGEKPMHGDKEMAEAEKSYRESIAAIESRRKIRQSDIAKSGLTNVRITQQPMSFHYHSRNQEVDIAAILLNREAEHQAFEADIERIREAREEISQGLARMQNQ